MENHARVFSRTLTHGNSKIEIRQWNSGRRQEEENEFRKKYSGHEKISPVQGLPIILLCRTCTVTSHTTTVRLEVPANNHLAVDFLYIIYSFETASSWTFFIDHSACHLLTSTPPIVLYVRVHPRINCQRYWRASSDNRSKVSQPVIEPYQLSKMGPCCFKTSTKRTTLPNRGDNRRQSSKNNHSLIIKLFANQFQSHYEWLYSKSE